MDQVRLKSLRFDTIVGILDSERITPQPIELDISLELDLLQCGKTGNLELGVDYAQVMDELMFLTKAGQFELLESLCLATCTLLLHPPHRPATEKVSITATKPSILAPHTSPCIAMTATAQRLPAPVLTPRTEGVEVAQILETKCVRVERLRLHADTPWSSERPCYSYCLGSALSNEDRTRAVLRPMTTIAASDETTDWLVVTRLAGRTPRTSA